MDKLNYPIIAILLALINSVLTLHQLYQNPVSSIPNDTQVTASSKHHTGPVHLKLLSSSPTGFLLGKIQVKNRVTQMKKEIELIVYQPLTCSNQ